MNTRFLPAGCTVVYTIEQKSTVPADVWDHFISAVTGIYYLLPTIFVRLIRAETMNVKVLIRCLSRVLMTIATNWCFVD